MGCTADCLYRTIAKKFENKYVDGDNSYSTKL